MYLKEYLNKTNEKEVSTEILSTNQNTAPGYFIFTGQPP